MLNNYPDVLTIADLTVILRRGRNTVYQLLQKGEIHSRRVGRKYLIPKKCVIDYLEKIRYTAAT